MTFRDLLRMGQMYLMIAVILLVLTVRSIARRTSQSRDSRSRRVLVIGAYGNGNYGDDIVGISIADAVQVLDLDVGFAARDSSTARLGVSGAATRATGRGLRSLGKVLRVARRADVILLGGGGLLEGKPDDLGVHRLIVEYLAKTVVASGVSRPYHLFGVGVSHVPMKSKVVAWTVAKVLAAADTISVRDRQSLDAVRIQHLDATLVQDPAVLVLTKLEVDPEERRLAVVLLDRHRWPLFLPGQHEDERAKEIADIVGEVSSSLDGISVVDLIPFHWSDPPLLEEVGVRLAAEARVEIQVCPYPLADAREPFERLLRSKRILTMRFHPGLCGMLHGRDVRILGKMQKLDELISLQSRVESGVYSDAYLDPGARLRELLHLRTPGDLNEASSKG